jgi:Holliday junction resolvasome RuvABC endonuclease subunit
MGYYEFTKHFLNEQNQKIMKNKKILALDLGAKTGWAIKSQNQITSGTIEFKPSRFEGGGMRYLRFQKWLEEINQTTNGIDLVYFEEVRRHIGVDAAHAYGGFLAYLTSWCEEKEIPYLGIPVGTIKKHITSKGNAGKSEVINEIKKLGFNPSDDNEADALALLNLIIKKHEGGLL